jgi:hypothetical protein
LTAEARTVELRLETSQDDLRSDLGPDLDIAAVEPLAEPSHGAALEEAHFVELVAVLVAGTVATIAKRIVDQWLRDRSQGVLIDVRAQPPLVSRVAGVPAGFLVLIDADGKATTHEAREDEGERLADLVSAVLGREG